MRILREDGRSALTIARLAKEADAAVGALYRYFSGKDALLAALQGQAILAFDEALSKKLEQLPPASDADSALLRVVALLETWGTFAEEAPELHQLIDESMSHPAPLLEDEHALVVEGRLDPLISRCTTLIDDAVAKSALSPGSSELRTFVCLAALHGSDHFRKRDRFARDTRRFGSIRRELIRTLLVGWGASPSTLETLLS